MANISLKLTIKYNNYRDALEKLTLAELEAAGRTLSQNQHPGWRWRLEFVIKLGRYRQSNIPTAWERILRAPYPEDYA